MPARRRAVPPRPAPQTPSMTLPIIRGVAAPRAAANKLAVKLRRLRWCALLLEAPASASSPATAATFAPAASAADISAKRF